MATAGAVGYRCGVSRRAEAFGEAAGRIAERFEARFGARVALDRDRARAAELAFEVRPVAQALLEGLAHASAVEPEAPELREAMALASLLGRRAGDLGVTPSGALAVVPVLLDVASAEAGAVDAGALEEPLAAVCLEGYVAAREERLEERAVRRAADAIPLVEVVPGCFAVLPAGRQSADELERVADEVGRTLLERDARACLVHAGGLAPPDHGRVAPLFAIHGACRMLGVPCIYSGLSDAWRRAAAAAPLDLSDVRLEPTFARGLAAALDAVGLETRPRAALGQVLRRLVGPRKER